MAAELGSVVLPMPGARRSTRSGHSSNGWDTQLNRLGDILVAPTHQVQKRFAPSDGLSLPDNILAPVPKKRWQNKKVCSNILIYHPALIDQKATLPPPVTLQPCQQLLPNIDPRLGFFVPSPSPTSLSPTHHHEAPAQLPLEPSYVTHRSSPQLSAIGLPTHSPPVYAPPPNTSPSADLNGSDSEGSVADGGQNHELGIDEQSDDEDDRAAHELLCAAPIVGQNLTNTPAVLPYDHQGFAVS